MVVAEDDGVGVFRQEPSQVAVVLVEVLCAVLRDFTATFQHLILSLDVRLLYGRTVAKKDLANPKGCHSNLGHPLNTFANLS